MMDDSMEISSEHGHNMRDEDIDIDIDLTTGHVDEDYILEDALPHQSSDNDFPFEASPAPGNDDLMIDEEDEAYHMNHAEGGFIPDNQSQDMADETAAAPFPATNGPRVYPEENETVHTDHFDVTSTKETKIANHQDATTHNSVVDEDQQPQDLHEVIVIEGNQISVGIVAEAEPEPPTSANSETNNRPASPHATLEAPTLTEEPDAPAGAFLEPTDETSKHMAQSNHRDDMTSHGSEKELHGGAEEAEHTEAPVLATPEILVTYQEVEYALFSTSDLDDPDSFFLSDMSILDSPISHFLKAIRDVIHEDLTSEDELCLSVGDMGIEAEESSTSIQDVTLRQVVTLYEKLLKNDGIVSPRPFCIQLGVRPGFTKRLANLVARAAEGKGLSELVFLAEPSNSPGESNHEAEEHNDDDGANIEVPERQIRGDAQHEQEDVGKGSDAPHPPNPDSDLMPSPDKAIPEQNDGFTTESLKGEPSQGVNGDDHENYEEDDLIDYSDEEVHTLDKPGKRNEVNPGGATQEIQPSVVNVSVHEGSDTNLAATEAEDYYQEEEANIENGIEFDEDNGESYSHELEAHEDSHEASNVTGLAETLENQGNNQQVPEPQPQLGPNGKSKDVNVDHDHLEDEIEYDDEDDTETAQAPKLSDEDLGLDVSENHLDDEHASDSEIGKITTPETGTNDKSLDASAIPDEAPEDEIDYDDDDNSGIPGTQTPLSENRDAIVPPDGSGKRQREDANLDEGFSMADKEVKRRKS